jgi:hypothetical protein
MHDQLFGFIDSVNFYLIKIATCVLCSINHNTQIDFKLWKCFIGNAYLLKSVIVYYSFTTFFNSTSIPIVSIWRPAPEIILSDSTTRVCCIWYCSVTELIIYVDLIIVRIPSYTRCPVVCRLLEADVFIYRCTIAVYHHAWKTVSFMCNY